MLAGQLIASNERAKPGSAIDYASFKRTIHRPPALTHLPLPIPPTQMTLPDHVLYVTQSKSKTSATFAANGQDLTWSGINLAKKGSSLRVRLKLNTTSCVDGQLAFAAAASVPDCPATASNNALASVKHRYGWTACPPPAPTELCYEPSYGAYECPNEVNVCGQGVDLPSGTANNMQECVQACLNDAVEAGYTYAKWIQLASGGQCVCYTTATGFSTNNIVASFALGQPRTPPDNGCA